MLSYHVSLCGFHRPLKHTTLMLLLRIASLAHSPIDHTARVCLVYLIQTQRRTSHFWQVVKHSALLCFWFHAFMKSGYVRSPVTPSQVSYIPWTRNVVGGLILWFNSLIKYTCCMFVTYPPPVYPLLVSNGFIELYFCYSFITHKYFSRYMLFYSSILHAQFL